MTTKQKLLRGIIAVVVLFGVWVVFSIYSNTGLRYIQKTTGVKFPRDISNISVYDSGEFYITAHVTVPMETVDRFASLYGFSPYNNSRLPGLNGLNPQFRVIPASADHGMEGRSANNRWVFVLDRTTGNLWVTVFYPDWSGDSP